jgi:hypothetical protein
VQVRTNPNKDYGYNAATGEYEDLMKAGIIDPAKVWSSRLILDCFIRVNQAFVLATHSSRCVVVHLNGFAGLAMPFLSR